MTRNAAIGLLLREIAEEMLIVLRALLDNRLWSAMVSSLMADHNVDELTEKIAGMPVSFEEPTDWREFYGAMRDMVNETGVTVR